MPVICIGPVCIPWTCVPAIVFFFWRFAKPLLPKDWAAAVEEQAKKASDACAPYLEKIPGCKKRKQATNGNGCCAPATAELTPGKVLYLASEQQLDALLERSRAEGWGLVLDFTASWCKPCQAMKPHFEALASQYTSHCFAVVDVEELDDVSVRCGVMGLPTFQVHLAGKQAGSITGAGEEKLSALLGEHLGSPNGSGDKKSS